MTQQTRARYSEPNIHSPKAPSSRIFTNIHEYSDIHDGLAFFGEQSVELAFLANATRRGSPIHTLFLVQVFVECLDRCFENVCELDIIFHSDKVRPFRDFDGCAPLCLVVCADNSRPCSPFASFYLS